jgi:hypothetical protein
MFKYGKNSNLKRSRKSRRNQENLTKKPDTRRKREKTAEIPEKVDAERWASRHAGGSDGP